MKIRLWVLLLSSLLIITSCRDKEDTQNQETPTETFQFSDPNEFNRDAAPLSIPIIIPSDNKLAARILLTTGKSTKPTVIFLHGNPGFEKNEDIGQALRRNGYNSVFFSYSGTWGNNGYFSYSQSLQDTKDVYEYLIQNSKKWRINTEEIYLLGHSMGGDIALIALEEIKGIKGVIALDPWSGYYVLNHKIDKQRIKYITNLEQRPCINLVSGESFVNDAMSNARMNLDNSLKNNPKSILKIFSTDREQSTFISFHQNMTQENMIVLDACDHSFSDKRISLAKTIYNWLESHNQ
ncbi:MULTISPECIES: alpha/beta hydrolase [unclassified Lentimicrobium]|uniref:alpha/beta hydrolase n=1 Tax=unclassified Lentimicrobium TaxID=2677434 RepID=UPI0015554D07|nr:MULTISPECIES: alpha/beta fold hydrolase [unclassified Lentimicrobium]NPD45470.1 alpha/beta hydrolase fold domain-containing protein [Lentimicrobium sp. S6]NPD86101.1 alpha/beta hydrolase fold domain-containing protein [Lentimicrobium sp. L6]